MAGRANAQRANRNTNEQKKVITMCKCIEELQQGFIGRQVSIRNKNVEIDDAVFNEAGLAVVNGNHVFTTYSTVKVYHGSKSKTIMTAHSYCPFCGVMNDFGKGKLNSHLKEITGTK